MAKHSKRRAPRAPFIVTVTAATTAMALALPGCGTTVTSGGEDPPTDPDCPAGYACNPPPTPSECPESTPAQDSACDAPGMECEYPDPDCEYSATFATCENGAWQVGWTGGSCNPPAPCPAEIPANGDACGWEEPICTYTVDTGCGPMDVPATCENGAWSVAIPICNPPPPEVCFQMTTEADCDGMGPTCRWLVPGCADPASPPPALAQAGCFPSYDCTDSVECPAGTACEQRAYDPCYNDVCDACGSAAMLCVAPAPAP